MPLLFTHLQGVDCCFSRNWVIELVCLLGSDDLPKYYVELLVSITLIRRDNMNMRLHFGDERPNRIH